MNLMSLNIRGVSESHKVNWIKELKLKHHIDFVGIQETHQVVASSIDIDGCWGNTQYDWEAVDSIGKSGGILCIWDPSVFSKVCSTSSRNYLAITGHWRGFPGLTTIVNVYGPQSITEKRQLWLDLTNLKNAQIGNWVLFGHFNAVRKREERFNS